MKTFLLFVMLLNCLYASAQPETNSKIEAVVNPLIIGKNHTIAIGIISGGEKRVIYFGDKRGMQGNQLERPMFEIGELSSLFTTTLLARMAILGEVNIETPVQDLLPGQHLPVYQKLDCEPVGSGYSLYACDPLANEEVISIVLCNLATHTAGFPRNPSNLKSLFHCKNPFARYTTAHLYRYLNNHPISFTSEFTYQYSHIGMALLGHSLSMKTGLPYEDLLQEKVLIPLALTDTRVALTAAQKSCLLQGYTAKGKATSAWDFDVLAPSAGVQASVEDMLQFLSVHMGQSYRDWLPMVKLAQNPREVIRQKELAGSAVGLGWITSKVSGLEQEVIWMEGQTGGFASYIGFLTGTNIGVVILSNHAQPVTELGKQVLKILDEQAKELQSFPAAIR